MHALAMLGLIVIHRSQDRQLVAQLRQPRHIFADLIAGHAGRNALELAAIFDRRVRLEVPHIQMAGPAGLEQQNHAPLFRGGIDGSRERFVPQQIGQRHAAEARPPRPAESRDEKSSNAEQRRHAAGR